MTMLAGTAAGSLKAFSQYRFEIIPFSGQVIGEGSVIFADTLTAKPGAPPSNVVMTTINATVSQADVCLRGKESGLGWGKGEGGGVGEGEWGGVGWGKGEWGGVGQG